MVKDFLADIMWQTINQSKPRPQVADDKSQPRPQVADDKCKTRHQVEIKIRHDPLGVSSIS